MTELIAQARVISTVLLWLAATLYVAQGQPGWLMLGFGVVAFVYGLATFDRDSSVVKGKFRNNPRWPSVVAITLAFAAMFRSARSVARSVGEGFEVVFGWLAFSPITAIVVVVTILVLVFAGAWLVTRPKKNS